MDTAVGNVLLATVAPDTADALIRGATRGHAWPHPFPDDVTHIALCTCATRTDPATLRGGFRVAEQITGTPATVAALLASRTGTSPGMFDEASDAVTVTGVLVGRVSPARPGWALTDATGLTRAPRAPLILPPEIGWSVLALLTPPLA